MEMNNYFVTCPEIDPQIYAYEDISVAYRGMLRIGYTNFNVEKVVAQQYPTARPGGKPYRIVFSESAMRSDGTAFSAADVLNCLERDGFKRINSDWIKCTSCLGKGKKL